MVEQAETADRSLLIVDDDAPLRNRLARAMEQRGFTVVSAASVAEGLEASGTAPPAYAVVDLRLEDGNGLEVVEALRAARDDVRIVMLTGTVKFAKNKQRATELIQGIKGVKRIVNELQVTNDYGPRAAANDLWIETKLKLLLLGTKGIRSINYRWRSVNGVVYLIGAGQSQQEMSMVLNVIRTTVRVKKVINHAWVRPPKTQ